MADGKSTPRFKARHPIRVNPYPGHTLFNDFPKPNMSITTMRCIPEDA